MATAPVYEKPTVHSTPKCKADGYVNLIKADTKYKQEGEFKIKVLVPDNAPGAVEMYEMIANAAAAEVAKQEKRLKTDPEFRKKCKGSIKVADLPFYHDTESGTFSYTFKTKATYVSKLPATLGDVVTRTVTIWDAKGKRYAPDAVPKFGAGSDVRVAYTVSPFFTTAVGAGVSLRLESVKLIKAVEFQGGGGANPFGDEDESEDESYRNTSFPDDDGPDMPPASTEEDDF
ncbi:putative ssDNA binding protein [Ralstonia phage RPSC1]|uniref:Putative ssDNA binding protein n=1 Tax=Ralstonia phage RPSC1 TaxID=2041351 RepID=A0A2Z2U7X3_9CAUD|nr:putative ssDNA binding protein [Ralstonia phage RPSC1]ATN92958.1 putative ssDNA binding protein [Ralstonia phage RPSC1]